jgi:hypothetical protein
VSSGAAGIDDCGHHIVDELAEFGRVVEVAGYQQAVAKNHEDLCGELGVRIAVLDEQGAEEITLPLTVFLNRLAYSAGWVRVFGGGVDEGATAIVRPFGRISDEVEDGQESLAS